MVVFESSREDFIIPPSELMSGGRATSFFLTLVSNSSKKIFKLGFGDAIDVTSLLTVVFVFHQSSEVRSSEFPEIYIIRNAS